MVEHRRGFGRLENIILVNAQNPENAKYQGRSIAAIAKEMKTTSRHYFR